MAVKCKAMEAARATLTTPAVEKPSRVVERGAGVMSMMPKIGGIRVVGSVAASKKREERGGEEAAAAAVAAAG